MEGHEKGVIEALRMHKKAAKPRCLASLPSTSPQCFCLCLSFSLYGGPAATAPPTTAQSLHRLTSSIIHRRLRGRLLYVLGGTVSAAPWCAPSPTSPSPPRTDGSTEAAQSH